MLVVVLFLVEEKKNEQQQRDTVTQTSSWRKEVDMRNWGSMLIESRRRRIQV